MSANGLMPQATTTNLKMPKMKLNAKVKPRYASANDRSKRLSGIQFVNKGKDLMKSKNKLNKN